MTIEGLTSRFVQGSPPGAYYGVTGWTELNAAGDRRYANFDFWAVRPSAGTHAWKRVAGYDTKLGTLDRP